MKQRDLIKLLKKNGWEFDHHGANHDIYKKGTEQEAIGRHKELPEPIAQAIIRRRGLK